MLRSCQYCGRVHDTKYDCGQKPKPCKRITHVDRFRRTQRWTDKSVQIRERDHYLCQVCARGLYNAGAMFVYDDISVHHAIPIEADWDKRLDDDNLITLCAAHHEMAEAGAIPYEEIKRMIDEQESQGM